MTTPLTARLEELIRTLYPEPCGCENGSGLVCRGCLGREELCVLVREVLAVAQETVRIYKADQPDRLCCIGRTQQIADKIRALLPDLEVKE